LVLFNVVNLISAFSKCYPVNGENHCFYTDGSTLTWDEAREFCGSRNSTLPIITDEHIDNVFERFISDSNNVTVTGSNNDYVWIDAYARQVNNGVRWHWINGQPTSQ